MINRYLNIELIDRKILEKGWTQTEAATRIMITYKTLRRIYERKNVSNDVILKVSKNLDIPLAQLVVWPANGDNLPARQ